MSDVMQHAVDVAIVGDGIVGLTLGLALAQTTSLSVAVLMQRRVARAGRVSAITLASKRIFERCGAWPAMVQQGVSPFNRIAVWDEANEGSIQFDSQDIAESDLGYIVDNEVMQSALLDQLRRASTVQFIEVGELTGCHLEHDMTRLVYETDVYQARLVVGADGAESSLRKKLEIACITQDYEQTAIVSTLSLSLPHQQVATQCFLKSGPIAALPLLAPNQASLVWSLSCKEAESILSLEMEAFCLAVTRAFNYRLGEVTHATARYAFPLRRQEAARYIATRVALVGDAAHTVHPLAGQGVNIGLLDAASLAQVVSEALRQAKDIGSVAVLRQYERWRRADNLPLLKSIDQLKQLFGDEKPWMQRLRSTGLTLLDRLPWIKRPLIRYAVGHRAHLPQLAQKVVVGRL
jgi:2-octaprenylphenol hydroxylase